MKTKEELNALKEELETLNRKLSGLSEEEFKQVIGGGPTTYDEGSYETRMKCSSCGHNVIWGGMFLNQTFDCPKCGAHTFKGVSHA